MIIDSHSHAWPRWPYQPPVPDGDSRGRIEQLLHEMDRHGVDQAVLVCARIDHNPDNNDYIFECSKQYPDRIIQFADVDCSWTDTYHTPGAADRLSEAADKYALKGYTHYFRGDDDGSWFFTDEGQRFFQTTADRGLISSLAMGPSTAGSVTQIGGAVPFHHLSLPPHGWGESRGGTTLSELKRDPCVGEGAKYQHQNVRIRVCLSSSIGISLFGYRVGCPCTL